MDIEIVQENLGKKLKIGLRSGAFYSGIAKRIQGNCIILYDKYQQMVIVEIAEISSMVNVTDNPRPYGNKNGGGQ